MVFSAYHDLNQMSLNNASKKMAKTKIVQHNENGIVCNFDSDHANQKVYRDSASAWFTVPAMAKIQTVFKDVLNPVDAVLKMAEMCKIALTESDLNRSREALNVVADTSKPKNDSVSVAILAFLKAGKSEIETIEAFKANGWTDEKLKPYFKSLNPVVPKPPQ